MTSLLRLSLRRVSLPVALTFVVVVIGAGSVAGGLLGNVSTAVVVAVGLTFFSVASLPLIARRVAGDLSWFHPLCMPTAYIAIALLLPLAYMMGTQRPTAGVRPQDVSLALVSTLALTAVGFFVGVLASTYCIRRTAGADVPRQWDRVLWTGRAMLVIAIIVRGYSTVRGWGTPYGRGSVDFGVGGTLQTVADFLSFTAPALIVLAQVRLHGSVAARADVVLFGVFCAITLSGGSRGELLAPVIFALWLHHQHVRPIPWRAVASGCVIVVVLFQAIQGVRAGDSPLSSPRAGVEGTLTALGVPMQVTFLTIASVPTEANHRLGDTYTESLKRQLPGVIAVKIWGAPNETGTFVLRRIIGFNSPDAGLGFALPAESYLNFGVMGALVVALLVGLLFGYAYEKHVGMRPSRAGHLLYGFLIASLPLSLRADAVLQIKAVLYPMVAVSVILALCCERPSEARRAPGLRLRRMRDVGGPPT